MRKLGCAFLESLQPLHMQTRSKERGTEHRPEASITILSPSPAHSRNRPGKSCSITKVDGYFFYVNGL